MRQVIFLQPQQSVQQRAAGQNGLRQVGDAQLSQALTKMLLQNGLGSIQVKLIRSAFVDAAVQSAHEAIVENIFLHANTIAQHFRRGKSTQFGNSGGRIGAAGGVKCAGGNVAEGKTEFFAAKQTGVVVVFVFYQHAAFGDGTGGDDAGDVTLHKALGGGGIGHLLANGHLVALLHQTGDVSIYGVVRNTAHGGLFFLGLAAITGGQGQIQFTGRDPRILVKHFVEVTQPEKQNTILIILFDGMVLPLHGGQFFIFCGHKTTPCLDNWN